MSSQMLPGQTTAAGRMVKVRVARFAASVVTPSMLRDSAPGTPFVPLVPSVPFEPSVPSAPAAPSLPAHPVAASTPATTSAALRITSFMALPRV